MKAAPLFVFMVVSILLIGAAVPAFGLTYTLANGATISGEPLMSTAGDAGLKVRMADGTYTNLSWGAFSQRDLKVFAKDKKLAGFVVPFIRPAVDRFEHKFKRWADGSVEYVGRYYLVRDGLIPSGDNAISGVQVFDGWEIVSYAPDGPVLALPVWNENGRKTTYVVVPDLPPSMIEKGAKELEERQFKLVVGMTQIEAIMLKMTAGESRVQVSDEADDTRIVGHMEYGTPITQEEYEAALAKEHP